jgi:hypothetical protein
MSELAALLSKRRSSIEDPAAAAAAAAQAARLDALAAGTSAGARDAAASPSGELADRLSRRRRLSDAGADAREVRRAKATAQQLRRKHKGGGDQGVDKVSGELGKKFDRRLAKEKIEDLRVASNIEASGEDAILAASRAGKAPAAGASASPELATKLRRRRQSMGEEVMTPTTGKSGARGDDDKSRGVARKKEREKREKDDKNKAGKEKKEKAAAPSGKAKAKDESGAALSDSTSSICGAYTLATFALFVLLLFIAYFVLLLKSLPQR